MNRTLRTVTVVLATLAATLTVGTTVAQASTHRPVSKADAVAIRTANARCDSIQDDMTWEGCIVGRIEISRNRAVTGSDYYLDGARAVFVSGTHPTGRPASALTSAEQLVLTDANDSCRDLSVKTLNRRACVLGLFHAFSDRYLSSTDVHWVRCHGEWNLVATNGSRKALA
jgi:hypothetical protein